MMSQLPELEWITEAYKHVGLKEIKGIRHSSTILSWLAELKAWWCDDENVWCGVFVAHCLKTAGVAYPKHWYLGLDYLSCARYSLDQPVYGCVAVKPRKGCGHVCFVVGATKEGKLVCLEGNQNNSVCFSVYSPNEFSYFMWYGVTTAPSIRRYNLPILNMAES